MNAETSTNFELDNYNSRFFITGKSKGSGLALYYSNKLNFKDTSISAAIQVFLQGKITLNVWEVN